MFLENSKFIYYPSLSSGNSKAWFVKNEDIADGVSCRFYDEDYEERYKIPYFLVSAGTNLTKPDFNNDMGLKSAQVIGDSGGYQIASGVWKWTDDKKIILREKVFTWLENNCDVGMNLDLPPMLKLDGKFDYCLNESYENFKYFNEKQTGKIRFLNILQGMSEGQYKIWYDKMKGFDFNGWSIGSGTRGNIQLLMYNIAMFLENKEFEKEQMRYLHLLGITSPKDFAILAILQKMFNAKYGDGKVQVSTDSSSPNRASIFGTYYVGLNWKTLSYVVTHFRKAGDYRFDEHFPCMFDGCPACKGRDINDIVPNFTDESSKILTMHNVYVYKYVADSINALFNSSLEAIKDSTSIEYVELYKSVEEMFNSSDPMSVYKKYKPFYGGFGVFESNRIDQGKIIEHFDVEEHEVEEHEIEKEVFKPNLDKINEHFDI